MSESQEVEALSTKKPRRRLTPEQRIEERKAEIAELEAKRQQKVRSLIELAVVSLYDANTKATAAGMDAESRMILAAIKALEPSA